MRTAKQIEALIGSTPLVDLSDLANSDATVLGKYEATNPGGSIKDRIAKAIVEDAEKKGLLAPGGTIIEPTSGNTGVGLAMVAAQRGYKLILTPGSEGMKGAIAKADEIHDATPGSIIAGQFVNPANPQAHYETTGPEIWADTEGSVDAIVAGVGTGGTISGTAKFLKEKNPAVYATAVEPAESPVLSGGKSGGHKIQGIGAGFVPKNYDASVIDEVLPVASADAIATKKQLSEKLGLLVGISSGAAVNAALQLAARPEFAGKTIVAILPDTGERYLSMDL